MGCGWQRAVWCGMRHRTHEPTPHLHVPGKQHAQQLLRPAPTLAQGSRYQLEHALQVALLLQSLNRRCVCTLGCCRQQPL